MESKKTKYYNFCWIFSSTKTRRIFCIKENRRLKSYSSVIISHNWRKIIMRMRRKQKMQSTVRFRIFEIFSSRTTILKWINKLTVKILYSIFPFLFAICDFEKCNPRVNLKDIRSAGAFEKREKAHTQKPRKNTVFFADFHICHSTRRKMNKIHWITIEQIMKQRNSQHLELTINLTI